MSILKTIYLQHLNGSSPNATLDANGNMTVTGTVAGASSNMFRNRIINGSMITDQRNSGVSLTPTDGQFTVDRWQLWCDAASKLSVQQSTTVPTGFKNSVVITSLSAYTPTSGQRFSYLQPIEGLNVWDLGWGATGAKSVTVSFWVRSSLTGTFGGWLRNSAGDRSYVFSYTINAANTWEQKTVTIPGDVSGTWLTTTGLGVYLGFSMGAHSGSLTTAGVWNSSAYYGVTGQTNLVSNNSATWYLTGVQFEVGTVATPFEFRQYGHELLLCQRYYWQPENVVSPTGVTDASGRILVNFKLPVTMRSTPTFTLTRVLSRGYDGFLVWPSSSTAVNTSLTFNFGATIDAQRDTVGVIFAGSQNSTAGYLNLGQDSVVKISAEL